MKTLQQCLDEAAKINGGYKDWADFMNQLPRTYIDPAQTFDAYNRKAEELYASQFIEPSSPSLQSEPVEQQKLWKDVFNMAENWEFEELKAKYTILPKGELEQLRKEIEELKKENDMFTCYKDCGNTKPYKGICLNCGSSLKIKQSPHS